MASGEPRPQPPPTVRYATIGDRLFAQIVDGAVAVGLFAFLASLVASRTGGSTGLDVLGSTLPLLGVLIAVALFMLIYFVLMESALGATLGKIVAEARVQDARSGRVVGYNAALTRNGMRLIDGVAFYLIGGLCAMVTPRRQRFGDLLANTVVVHRPTNGALRVTSLLFAAAICVGGVVGGLALRPEGGGGPSIDSVVLSDDANGATSKTTFSPTTPRLYLLFTLGNAPLNTAVRAAWFAPGANPQSRFPLGESEIRTGGIQSGGTFTIEAPPNGWIAGDYRVNLSLNGTPVRTERFSVSASAPSASTAPSGSAVRPSPTATARPTAPAAPPTPSP